MSNGYGNYRTTRDADMAAHDAAPPRLRYAMNYAVGSIAAVPVLRHWRNGVPEAALISSIARVDAHYTRKTYGPTHPEAIRD